MMTCTQVLLDGLSTGRCLLLHCFWQLPGRSRPSGGGKPLCPAAEWGADMQGWWWPGAVTAAASDTVIATVIAILGLCASPGNAAWCYEASSIAASSC